MTSIFLLLFSKQSFISHIHSDFSNSIISNASFINTIQNESSKNSGNFPENVPPIKSKRSEEESYNKDSYTYEYSISNASNINQTILEKTSHREKIKVINTPPSNFQKENFIKVNEKIVDNCH